MWVTVDWMAGTELGRRFAAVGQSRHSKFHGYDPKMSCSVGAQESGGPEKTSITTEHYVQNYDNEYSKSTKFKLWRSLAPQLATSQSRPKTR